MSIVLCGFKACGKTTLGELLAEHQGVDWLDSDAAMVDVCCAMSQKKEDISSIYSRLGEQKFRQLEAQLLSSPRLWKNKVVSLGGGVIENDSLMHFIRSQGTLIYLRVSKPVLWGRWQALAKNPALVAPNESLAACFNRLYFLRMPLYNTYAHHVLEMTDNIQEDLINLIALIEQEKYGK